MFTPRTKRIITQLRGDKQKFRKALSRSETKESTGFKAEGCIANVEAMCEPRVFPPPG